MKNALMEPHLKKSTFYVWQNFEKQKLLGVSEKLKENKKIKKKVKKGC